MTHSRLSEEYKEYSVFRDNSMTLRSQHFGQLKGAFDDRNFLGSGKILNPTAKDLMRHVNFLRIFLDFGEINYYGRAVYPEKDIHRDYPPLLDLFPLRAPEFSW